MTVIASLVVGSDGSTTPSNLLSNESDRAAFLALRKSVDCIMTGGETFRSESYRHTPVPLVVISRKMTQPDEKNPDALFWNLEPSEAINRVLQEFGSRIHLECGPNLLTLMIEERLIDELHLTITTKSGGSGLFNSEEVLNHFQSIERYSEGTNEIIVATKPK